MSERTLVVISAGVGTPSSSQLLADRLAQASRRVLATAGAPVEVRHIELRTLAAELAHHLTSHVPSPALADAYAAVGRAVGVIVVSPVFNASYSGLFKMFFDLMDEGVMAGRPVLLAATGGSARHSLVIATAMLPLFHYLKAAVTPTGVFAATADWGDSAGQLRSRIESAGREFAQLVAEHPGAPAHDEFGGDIDFAETAEAAGTEQARLDFCRGGRVIQRFAECAIGEAAAKKGRGEHEAGEDTHVHSVFPIAPVGPETAD